jgi:hypothetical protein
LSGLANNGGRGIPQLTNLKPMLVAAYSEPDSLTVATNSDVLGASLGRMLTSDPGGWSAGMVPFGDFAGTRERKKAYR